MRLKIYPSKEDDEDRFWVLDLSDDGVVLTDHKDRVKGDWSAKKSVTKFHMPDFWTSRKAFSIATDSGVIDFDLTYDQLRKVKDFLDRQHVRANPNVVTQAAVLGVLMAVGGAALAVAATVVTFKAVQNDEGGVIWYGGIIFEPIIAVRGVMKLFDSFRLKRLVTEVDAVSDE